MRSALFLGSFRLPAAVAEVALAVCLKSLLLTKGTRKPWQSSFEEGNYVLLTQLVSQVTRVFHVFNRVLRGLSFMKYPLQKYGECTTPDAYIEKHIASYYIISYRPYRDCIILLVA